MKKAYFAVVIILLGTLLFPQKNDIRKLKWGMSYDNVSSIEGLGNNLYKNEVLLGVNVEVVFGCGSKGLHSVIYSTDDTTFVIKVSEVLDRKYGQSKKEMDYSFLLEAKEILQRHPKAVIELVENDDYTELNRLPAHSQERKIIKGGLAKRAMWEYDNTVVHLLDNITSAVLSYRPKSKFYKDKDTFNALLKELKTKVAASEQQKAAEEMDNI